MKKTIKNILFRVKIKGNGIVNFDSSDQKWLYVGTNLHHMKTNYANTSYAKKKLYGQQNNLRYKISISSDCLRHEIFKDDVMFQSPNLINSPALLYSFIASPVGLLRGYLFAEQGDPLKRKSAITLIDAQQTCDAVSYIELFSKSGMKNKNIDEVDNTLFKKETVGDIKYETEGDIDLAQMQFVSASQLFDRYGFNPDLFDTYKKFLKSKLPSFNSELGYYGMKDSSVELSEYGFKLSDEDIQILVRLFFKKLLSMNIKRKSAYARVENLEYKFVYDPIEDRFENENGWTSISSMEDINNISFSPEQFYIEEDAKQAEAKNAAIQADYEKRKQNKKANDAEKKALKGKNKKTDNTKNDEDEAATV
jgi:hypothetical protein